MSDERLRILRMLKDGKITVEEADKLLAAIQGKGEPNAESGAPKRSMKYLRIVEDRKRTEEGDFEKHLDVRIPLVLLRAGVKLNSVLPANAREKVESALKDKLGGIGIDVLETDTMEALTEALSEEGVSIEIERPNKTIKVFCE